MVVIMGAVNTASSSYSNSHISLESINPLFDANTPIYLVVDEMKFDNADYDIDVTLFAPVSNFWKSYPENGKTHVEIRTKIDNDDNVVRTVTCTCASGRIYTNVFTKNGTPVYGGWYDETTEPSEELFYSDIEKLVSYAVDPTKYRDNRTTHIDALLSTVYGVDVSDLDITTSVNGVTPRELITSGRLFDFIWWLLDKGVKMPSAEQGVDDAMSKPIPILNMENKIKLFSSALDVRFSVYELFLTLCTNYSLINGYTPSIDMYSVMSITPGDVVAAYIASRQWKYTGWSCIDESTIFMAERCSSCDSIENGDTYSWNTNGMYNTVSYTIYDTIDGAVTNVHLDRVVTNGCVNTKLIPFVCPETVVSLKNTAKHYENIGIDYGDLLFRPIDKSKLKIIITKKPYSDKSDIKDIIVSDNVHFIGDTNIDSYDSVVANIIFDTDRGVMVCETTGTNTIGAMINTSAIDKYLGAFTTESITLGTPDNTYTATNGFTYYWGSFGDNPYTLNDDIGVKLADLNIYGNSSQVGEGTIYNAFVRVITSNDNIITNQLESIRSDTTYYGPIINQAMRYAEDTDDYCINRITENYIPMAREDGDENTAYRLLVRVETVDNPDKSKARLAVLTLPGTKDPDRPQYHDVIPCPFSTDMMSCDIMMDITIGTHVKYIYLAYDGNVITKIKSACIVPANHNFIESRYNRTDDGVSLASIPVITDSGETDVRYKDKLKRNGDGVWVVEKRVLISKIHVKPISGYDAYGYTNKAIFVNDAMMNVKCDIASSDPTTGKYVFYIGKMYETPEYGTDITAIGDIPIYILNAKSAPTDDARITSENATVKYIPVGTSVADIEVDDYVIDIPMGTLGTECVPANISYIVTSVGGYINTIPFTATTIDSAEFGYDIRGNRVVDCYGANIVVVCQLAANTTDPVGAFITKLESKPIDFRFAPIFGYNDNGGIVSPYPVTQICEEGYVTTVENISLEVPLNSSLQNQYNSLRSYKNGYLGLILFHTNAYLEAKYVISP
jgi:hypothetical protein